MIKMNMPYFKEGVELRRGKMSVLVLCNKELFSRTVFDFFNDVDKNELQIFDTKAYEEFMDIVKVPSVLNFEANSPKFIKLLYESIERSFMMTGDREELITRYYNLQRVLGDVIFRESDLDLVNDSEFSMKNLLKFYGIRMNLSDQASLVDDLIQIINIMFSLRNDNLIVLQNLAPYLSSSDWDRIAKKIEQTNLRVLTIENSIPKLSGVDISVSSVDEDLFFVTNAVD